MARLDPREGFDLLKDRVTTEVKAAFPQEGNDHILDIEDVEIPDELDPEDIEGQKKAKLGGSTWGVTVKANFVLKDKTTGKVINRSKIKVATIPKHTRRHSFIVGGSEYQVDNQWRLKPGVYTRVAQNGQLESRFNFQGKMNLDMIFDPKSRRFQLKHGGSKPPLYPILKAVGIDDDTLQKSWGKEILNANKTAPSGKVLNVEKLAINFAKRLDPDKDVKNFDDAGDTIREYMGTAELRPDVTKLTLGKEFKTITPEALTRTSGRLLGVARGEKPDVRDALQFKDLLSTEDFIAERLQQSAKTIKRRIHNNIDRKATVREIVGPDIFDRPIKEFFSKTSLANTPQQVNPLEMLSGQQRTTITGEGGVKSAHKIQEDAKLVDPSHFGVLDPLHTPESDKTGVTLHLAMSAVKKGNKAYVPLHNIKTGKIEYLDPETVNEKIVAMPDEGKWQKGKWVPNDKKVKASSFGNEIRDVDSSKVQYVMKNPGQMFSIATNMVPFLSCDSPNRSSMAGKQMEQAISLKYREPPLVQVSRGDGTKKTFDEFVGRYASHESPVDGKVTKITDTFMEVKSGRQTHKVQLYKDYPLNDKKGLLQSSPVVKVGDKVEKGQVVADTNFTKGGVYAPGVNLNIGYTPWKGYNFEDGVVISETAAKKLTSEHMHKKTLSTKEAKALGKEVFMSHFASSLDKEQADKLDKDGIIRPGMKIRKGDTLIAAVADAPPTTENQMFKNLHRSLVKPFDNRSVTWEEDQDGEVVNVTKKGKKIQVHVKTEEPMTVGDKMVGRHGNKGIVTRVLPDNEMPTTKEGKPLEVLMNPIGIAGRMNIGQVLETAASKVAEKRGRPLKITNFGVSDSRTEIENLLNRHGVSDRETIVDPKDGTEIDGIQVGKQYILKLQHQVDKKMSARDRAGYDRNLIPKGGGKHGAQALGALGMYAMLAHGAKCLVGRTTLRTKDGGRVEISDVVKNRKTVEILCADPETKELDYKPVVAWSVRVAEPEELCCISVAASNPSGRKHFYKLKCTENHTIYTDRGKVQAGDLEEGDWLLTPGVRLHPFQRQMILGSVLGDGSLSKSDTFASSYRVTHGEAQREYCDWKREICSGITRADKLSTVTKGRGDYSDGPKFRFWTKSVGELSELRRMFYPEGKKIIPQEVLDELNEIGLAFWFMDDGNTDVQKDRPQKYRTVRLAICDFDDDSVDRAQKWFERRWGLHSTVQRKSGKYPYLHFFNENATEFLKIVAPYIFETMQYKLRLDVDHHEFSSADLRSVGSLCPSLLVRAVEGLEKVAVLSVDPYEPKHYEDYLVYNVEVEDHHNYVADGVLVGNSNIREMQTYKCMPYHVKVETDHGPINIGKIVNQKMDVKVLSRNPETGELEYKPIKHYWKREMDNTPLVRITTYSPCGSGVLKKRDITFTHEHEIFDGQFSKTHAKKMSGRCCNVPSYELSPTQRSVLVGSLLGDGSLRKHLSPFPAFVERHSIRQREYLEFKAEVLDELSRMDVRPYNAGYEGFNVGQDMCDWRTLSLPELEEFHALFYSSGEKAVPDVIGSLLNPLAVAVWFQDDGSLTFGERQRIVRIHTGSFTEKDRSLLKAALKRLVGVEFTDLANNGSWDLRLGTSDEIDQFLDYIRPYVHPSMSYKVGGGECGWALDDLVGGCSPKLTTSAVKVLSVRPYRPKRHDGNHLYNIEVEDNHNYFAGGLLVGNSDKAQNDDLWAAIQTGEPLPPPKTTFGYQKFESYLKGMGVDTKKDGNSLNLIPMTDKQVEEMSSGALKDAGRAVRGYKIGSKRRGSIDPEKSGLFDPDITGGLDGDRWSHIDLAEPVPNPLFEKAVRSITGIRGPQFNRLIEGKEGVDKDGKIVPAGTKGAAFGPKSVGILLDKVDVDKDLREIEARLPKIKNRQPINEARRKVKYLRALKKIGMSPSDAYMTSKIPVLPPSMRPLSMLEDGALQFDDLNQLYKDVALLDQQVKEMPSFAPESAKSEARADIYDRMKALTGLGGSLKGRYKGIADIIAGDNPKTGYAQDKLIKRKMDLSMRSTIVPEPSLSLDEVAIPRKAAMEIYKPFIVRELRMSTGSGPLTAKEMVEANHPAARDALQRVVEDRPLLMKRDPVLHKYGIQAFKPQITEGKAIKIHPLVCSGFNADFDGDTMSATVPITEEAVDEARKMYPSKMLFNPATKGVMYTPAHEAQVGLYMMSDVKKKTNYQFKDQAALEKAVREKRLGSNDAAKVGQYVTTLDRMKLDATLPKQLQGGKLLTDLDYRFTKKDQGKLFKKMAEVDERGFPKNIDMMKDAGNLKVTHGGFSFGLSDFKVHKDIREPIMREADRRASNLDLNKKNDMNKFVDIYEGAMTKMKDRLNDRVKELSTKNSLAMLETAAGIKGKGYAQLTTAPGLFVDAKGEVVASPVRKSYSEGLSASDYWASVSGGRKGIIQRTQSTAKPGYLTKLMMNSVMDTLVQEDDCGTDRGVSLNIDEPDLIGRYTTAPLKIGKTTFKPGTLVTSDLVNKAKNSKVSRIVSRSPMRCNHAHGVCAKCMGLNERGEHHSQGTNIGVLAAQAIGERGTQLAMKAFHCLHPKSLVTVCPGRGQLPIMVAMEDLFHLVDSPIEVDEDGEFKRLTSDDGWLALDGEGWTLLTMVRRHEPTRPMVMVSDQSAVTICQDNHPIAVRENLVQCEECGNHRLKKPSPASSIRNGKHYCSKCGHYQLPPEEKVGSLGFLPPAEIEAKRWYGERRLLPPERSIANRRRSLDLDPYFIGAYLAEGWIGYRWTDPNNRVKKPYSIGLKQEPGPIRDRILERAHDEWNIRGKAPTIEVHNLKLGQRFEALFNRYSRNKALPPDFIHFEDEWLADCLCGLVDGDGTPKADTDRADRIAIDTTSFELAQQVVVISARLGIVSNLLATAHRELTRHQGFRVVLRITERAKEILGASVKVSRVKKCSPDQEVLTDGQRLISNVRPVFYDGEFVYDVTTSSSTFVAGGLLNHNSGGVYEGKAAQERSITGGGFERAVTLLSMPNEVKGSAKLATASGRVESIRKDPAGGFDVKIGGVNHYIPADRRPLVGLKKGKAFRKGDPLTNGPINPRELLPLTNMNKVQGYLASELHSLYAPEGIRRRNSEVLVRSLSNVTKVEDSGDSATWIRGDFAPTSVVNEWNRKNAKRGIKPVSHTPVLRGVKTIPEDVQTDWLARLNHENIRSTLVEAAQQGWASNLHGDHPIPPMIVGKEFGKGTKEKPWSY